MGYYIRSLPTKKSPPKWKVQFISFKKADAPESNAKKPKRHWDIPKPRWSSLGFNNFMTKIEAQARAKQLNAQLQIKRQEEQLRKIAQEIAVEQLRYDAILPSEFVAEFEARFIRSRNSNIEQNRKRTTRAYVGWRSAQRMIAAVGIEPSEWFYHYDRIYDYFFTKQVSVQYLQSILKIANLWGFFICRKLARPFLPIPPPRGYERQRLVDANFQKSKGVTRPSKPLSPESLNLVRNKLNQTNFNWLFLSVWFGLRPNEIDSLKKSNLYRIETTPGSYKVLWVFQTKIITLTFEERWKPIPILFDQQRKGLEIIASDIFRRPLEKTMRLHFGEGITLYAGRKGFTDLMLALGQSFTNISIWMGHSTLQRTWQNYKNRQRFHLPEDFVARYPKGDILLK